MKKPQKERRIEQRRKQQILIWSWQDRRKDSNGFINTTKSLGRRSQ